ncbi:MAG: hypothetical protein ACLVBP_13320 [Ruminococcus sp.]
MNRTNRNTFTGERHEKYSENQIENRIRKLLSDKRGFSLGELLAATVILLLASRVMTQGMAFATPDV